jgi:putative transposase
MPEYRRNMVEGGIYFFTVVTYKRRPMLTRDTSRRLLHFAWEDVQHRFPFETVALCLLPDHLHCRWKLPEGDSNYSMRWKEIKRLFSRQYNLQIGSTEKRNDSRIKRQETTIWQRRFWEHTIQNESDYDYHLDYIHSNPIKHGYVSRAADWQWSTFERFVQNGTYDIEWVGGNEGRLQGAIEGIE